MAEGHIEGALARHVHALAVDKIEPETLDAFDRLLLDFTSVYLAGQSDPECRRISGALDAAFAYGTSAHWFDWDDTHDESHVHGGAVIFSALLAASSSAPVDPPRFTAAAIAAYDVACRIGGFLKQHAHRGWMPTGSGATIGAAAAVAKLFGLDESGIVSAMGIAAANAGLSRQALADRTNAKAMLAGIAARTALDAALLAKAGANGAPHFLTGVYGLHALHAGSQGNPEEAVRELGQRFSIDEVSVKPYPCCRSTHAVIDGVLQLRREDQAFASRVRRIEADVPAGVYERCGAPFKIDGSPRLAAQFSIPFVAAFAVRRGAPALEDFADRNVLATASELETAIAGVSVRAEPKLGGGDALAPVALQFSDGERRLERRVETVSGSPQLPVTSEQAHEKLRSAAAGRYAERELAELEDVVRAVRRSGPAALVSRLAG